MTTLFSGCFWMSHPTRGGTGYINLLMCDYLCFTKKVFCQRRYRSYPKWGNVINHRQLTKLFTTCNVVRHQSRHPLHCQSSCQEEICRNFLRSCSHTFCYKSRYLILCREVLTPPWFVQWTIMYCTLAGQLATINRDVLRIHVKRQQHVYYVAFKKLKGCLHNELVD